MKKVIALSLSLVMLAGVMTACSSSETEETTTAATTAETTTEAAATEETSGEASEPFLTYTDFYGNEVVIESEPQTIVSVSPTMTEIVYALGQGDKLVARTDYCDYPAEALNLPSIGAIDTPDIEAIVALDPDLILASSIFTEDSYNQLTELGYTVAIVIDEDTFDGMYNVVDLTADIIGASDAGDALVADLKAEADSIIATDDTDITVYYCMGFGEYGEYIAGGDTFINQIIELAGAKNAAADVEGWTYDLEALIAADPDYILIAAWGYDSFISTAPYSDLTAVKEGHVIVVDNNLFERQGPRNVEALKLVNDLVNGAAEATEETAAAA